MDNVVSLDSRRAHLSGPAICTKCNHTWRAVILETGDADTMECPNCNMYFGTFRGPEKPETGWRCNCGCDLFYLTPDGHKCHSCGQEGVDWMDTL